MKVTLLLRQRPVVKLALVGAAAVCPALGVTSGAAVAGTHAPAGARSAVSSGTWGAAQEVPGLAALNNKGGTPMSIRCRVPRGAVAPPSVTTRATVLTALRARSL